ncbi:cell cycle regulator of non-homologous end joining [Grammomys surdaster]|uniref:cell cycle regulator of non-homologous end joining n=1 Tax=Grammomys surdaster TaxID=491861 RepID=UPI0010A03E8A|nr:cell cycle regulator of non-homologous end joining [Grammomys surdaster]XP_028624266.1 cell cycle regulator of non-homologous end joining [Grammomys surdaster]XP_028624267.1 cell cycle regulator of non-homologous end joining [Grammomys surdaster]XP_028624268.1 cell cycle regulator of non-homologous end joining [Grammomys surdaster]XP_028624269.1 cell cycle regulator of non-homologous end joining [Grammomys surdaster]
METLKSENKKRVLPSWMTDPVNERKVISVKTTKRKQTAAVRVGAATRASATETVYCMNEAEMVDVALGILIEGRKQEKPWEQLSLEVPDKLQLSPPCSPHTSSPENSSEEEDSRNNSPALGLSPPQGPEAADSLCSRSPEEEKEEEDELKYVREIFFS